MPKELLSKALIGAYQIFFNLKIEEWQTSKSFRNGKWSSFKNAREAEIIVTKPKQDCSWVFIDSCAVRSTYS